MWRKGAIKIEAQIVCYEVKVYDTGSVFGINEGRISKLWLSINGKMVANYDRGWDVEPTCKAAELALAILLEEYKEN